MIKVYKVDKVACLKHIASSRRWGFLVISISIRRSKENGSCKEVPAKNEGGSSDKTAQLFGPPDHTDNFVASSSKKRNVSKRKCK